VHEHEIMKGVVDKQEIAVFCLPAMDTRPDDKTIFYYDLYCLPLERY